MTLPKNLHIVHARPETPTEKVRAALGSAAWLDSPDAWDMDKFIAEIDLAMVEAHGDTLSIDQHLVGLLATQVDLYVRCWASIKTGGLVTTFNLGQTQGKNSHLSIADKALSRVASLLVELGLTPKSRPPSKPSGRFAELIAGP